MTVDVGPRELKTLGTRLLEVVAPEEAAAQALAALRVRLNPTGALPEFLPPAQVDPEQKPQRNRYHRRE